ncbi:MAG TPA: ChbG/HpnK family deacetylase [Gemmatimonadales bacterium]|nr:ChbG/HpnK family deacetylase [Gemmatimonadales bacterium]
MSILDATAEPRRPEGIRRLVINADDFGLSEGTNRGIRDAHLAGVVTAASLLVNAPGFEAAVRAAHEMPALSVGLHLNLTMGQPVSSPDVVPTLCDSRNRRLYPLSHLIRRALAGKIDGSEVARECAAQLERLRATGLRITHLDGHQHTHVLPGVWGPVVDTARQAGVETVRIPLEPPVGIAWRPMAALAQILIAASYRVASGGAARPVHQRHFRGFALTGRRDFTARLLALLDSLEPGTTELMVHPGYTDAGLAGWVDYTAGRELELAALTSAAVRARLARGDIELTG